MVDRTRHWLREPPGAKPAMRHERLRRKSNLLAMEKSVFFSARVHPLF
jgi:hypothetical protein